jgi:ribonuclease D
MWIEFGSFTLGYRLPRRNMNQTESLMFDWIDTSDALRQFLDGTGPVERLALDTEFVRERTYHAQLALIQVEVNGRIALIDPLATDDVQPLIDLLRGPALKLVHSPGEDLQVLAHRYRTLPTPLFDTQIAAALAGFGAGIGYQRLVETVLGITLAKGETRSDWIRRPLSPAQQQYAAEDVLHLDALFQVLSERLDSLGRRAWLDEDCGRLLAACTDEIDPNPHLSMRPAQRMGRDAQARLRRMLLWRELEARSSDKPRGWILDNDTVLRLADRPPPDRKSFERLLDAQPKAPRRKREPLWDLLQRPLDAEERDIPLAVAGEDVDRNALRALQAEVAAVAAESAIPEGTLCARRHLESLLLDHQWPSTLGGWREALLRERLSRHLP